MAKRIGLTVLLLALLGGPGYFVYLKYWSGQRVVLAPVGADLRPIAVVLAPEMDPVRVIMHWRYDTLVIQQSFQNRYTAALVRNGQLIARSEFSVSAPSGDKTPATSSSAAILDARINEAGEYVFTLAEPSKPALDLQDIEIEFRRNAVDPPLAALWGGIGLAVIAALFVARAPGASSRAN